MSDTLISVGVSRAGTGQAGKIIESGANLFVVSQVAPGQANEGSQELGMANSRKKRRSLPVNDDREIFALFFKNVREGISLKSLSESVAKDFVSCLCYRTFCM